MLTWDYLTSDDNEVITAILLEKVRDQACDIERLQELAETLHHDLQIEKEKNTAAKKSKTVVSEVKRGRGRPKKEIK